MDSKFYDFIIIGSGLAGLYSAFHASKFGTVAIISKANKTLNSSFLAQGDIVSAIGKEDSPQFHFEDTIKVGKGICNEKAVKILVEEGLKEINELISAGIKFDKSVK
ncbi:FAD-binding protein [Stygiobacter electus]|uniref:FAD-binding protein n=1 Tax=Stygiobacter electus TaxID=3032292 RepID=A0AAE3TD62_9BACT|nr:FAD-binding protein [Stygiobacter electus]MDF1612196.1 FAD-binding protein [Stygiobacter electus]